MGGEERDTLHEVVKRLKGTGQKVRRAQVLLKADANGPGWTDGRIAEAFSWLNIAENELSSVTRHRVAGRRIGDIKTLREESAAWSTDVNATQRGVDWQMKTEDAPCKLKSAYPKLKL